VVVVHAGSICDKTVTCQPAAAPSEHEAVAIVVNLRLEATPAAYEPECLTVALSTEVVAQVRVRSVDDVVVRLASGHERERPPHEIAYAKSTNDASDQNVFAPLTG
jgi:hypothetical protein